MLFDINFDISFRYGWVKEGTKGAQGMPLNVQIIGRPWNEELVLRAMIGLQNKVKF